MSLKRVDQLLIEWGFAGGAKTGLDQGHNYEIKKAVRPLLNQYSDKIGRSKAGPHNVTIYAKHHNEKIHIALHKKKGQMVGTWELKLAIADSSDDKALDKPIDKESNLSIGTAITTLESWLKRWKGDKDLKPKKDKEKEVKAKPTKLDIEKNKDQETKKVANKEKAPPSKEPIKHTKPIVKPGAVGFEKYKKPEEE